MVTWSGFAKLVWLFPFSFLNTEIVRELTNLQPTLDPIELEGPQADYLEDHIGSNASCRHESLQTALPNPCSHNEV